MYVPSEIMLLILKINKDANTKRKIFFVELNRILVEKKKFSCYNFTSCSGKSFFFQLCHCGTDISSFLEKPDKFKVIYKYISSDF
jgi:hypothetical protein